MNMVYEVVVKKCISCDFQYSFLTSISKNSCECNCSQCGSKQLGVVETFAFEGLQASNI